MEMPRKVRILLFVLLVLPLIFSACATLPPDRYNTQKGAAIGGGLGALVGYLIGGNTGATLLGAGIGTGLGAIIGNSVDQQYELAREAAARDTALMYEDQRGVKIVAIPEPVIQGTDCRKVSTRKWENGNLVSETTEEICTGRKKTRDY